MHRGWAQEGIFQQQKKWIWDFFDFHIFTLSGHFKRALNHNHSILIVKIFREVTKNMSEPTVPK